MNGTTDMFLPRAWTYGWLDAHCRNRFGVTPAPRALADAWGFDINVLPRVTSHIVFTNGLRDGWAAGGVPTNLSDSLLVFNMTTGAHHSDLAYKWPDPATDTPDVTLVRELVAQTITRWLAELRARGR